MPTSWLDKLEDSAKSGAEANEELEKLKYWVQDLSNRIDSFMKECKYGEQDPLWFVKRLQKDLEKKTNEIMGYK